MRLPRMTTRRWMIAVALLALGLACVIKVGQLSKKAIQYRLLAAMYNEDLQGMRYVVKGYDAGRVVTRNRTQQQVDRMVIQFRKMIPYRAALARKYEHAARYPWLPVPPDPPEPK